MVKRIFISALLGSCVGWYSATMYNIIKVNPITQHKVIIQSLYDECLEYNTAQACYARLGSIKLN